MPSLPTSLPACACAGACGEEENMMMLMLNMRAFERLNHADTRVGGGEGRVKNLNNGSDTVPGCKPRHSTRK